MELKIPVARDLQARHWELAVASFSDPNGGGWAHPGATARFSGAVEAADIAFTSELVNTPRMETPGQ
jgi:hypothetical protein